MELAETHSYSVGSGCNEYLSPSVAYRHHVILGMIFRELTLQGLFDVCPMSGVAICPSSTTPQWNARSFMSVGRS